MARCSFAQFGIRRLAGAVSIATLLIAGVTCGLDIQLTFDDSTPYIDGNGVDRTYDIVPIMEAAAAIWEDIIEDSHTLNVTYRWKDLTGVNNTNGPAAEIGSSYSGNRAVSASASFDTHLNPSQTAKRWFFDPTPFVNEEHSVAQKLYRELTTQQQLDWYGGSVPDVFEAEYWGEALPTAPDDARFGNDLLSVALHELGHPLGIPGSGNGLGDGDYDVQASQVGFNAMAINVAPGANDHLPNSHALVAGGIGDWRKLPSVTDILATASTSGWTQIDLPRKDLLDAAGFDNWNTPANWIGGRVPDAQDDVYLRDGNGALYGELSGSAVAKNLMLADGAWLKTNNQTLDVGGTITIDGAPAATTTARLIGNAAGLISTNFLQSVNGGELDVVAGSTLRVNRLEFNGPLDIDGNFEVGHVAESAGGQVFFGDNRPNASLQVGGTTTLGAEGGAFGQISVDQGGVVNTGTVVLGTTFSEGRIAVANGGQWTIDGQLIVGQDNEAAKGQAFIGSGGQLHVTGSTTVKRGQAVNGLLDVRSGGHFTVDNFLNLPAGSEVVIDDPLSRIDAGTIDNSGGTIDLFEGQIVATNFFNNTGGTLNHSDGDLVIFGGDFRPVPAGADYTIAGANADDHPMVAMFIGAHNSVAPRNLLVGDARPGALFVVNSSSFVVASDAFIGQQAGSAGSNVHIGVRGALDVGQTLWIGGGDNAAGPGDDASLQVDVGGEVNVGNHFKIWDPGVVNLTGGLLRVPNQFVNVSGGHFTGYGTLEGDLFNNGSVAARAFQNAVVATMLNVVGDYTQTDAGVLEIDLVGNGGSPGIDFGQLDVDVGVASLTGTLDVALVGGFAPKAGDSFEVLTAENGLNGTFAHEVLPGLSGDLAWIVSYGVNNVVLGVTTPFSADFDLDGDVDGNDRGIWETHFGHDAEADADGDLDSDGRDLLLWQRQHGGGVPAMASSQLIPEPASLGLLALALASGALSTMRY